MKSQNPLDEKVPVPAQEPSVGRSRKNAWRWFYAALITLAAAAVIYREFRNPVRAYAGPAVFAPALPAYAQRTVVIHAGEPTYGDLFADVSKQAGVPIEVLWSKAGPFTSGMHVELTGGGTYTLADAMELLSDAAYHCAFEFDADKLVVGTSDLVFSPERAEVKVYPIGDLLAPTGLWSVEPSGSAAAQEIIDAITESVRPEAWRAEGGTVGSIGRMGDKLVITATPGMHYQIEQLLNSLRQAR